ncbi:MAG: hypothetical protein AB8G99_14095 [Planctomycetaceae bacterium]
MDRNQALEQLEVVRSESDLSDPELANAINALEDDISVRQELDRRLELDQTIASVMQQVQPPAELRDRLHAACQSSTGKIPATSPKSSRRKILAVAATAAIALLAGFLLIPNQVQVSFSQIVQTAPRGSAEVARLAANANDDSFEPSNLPLRLQRLQRDLPSVGWSPESGKDATSLVVAGRGWVLVATPRERVREMPNGTTVGGVTDGFAYKAWENSDFVYVLFVPGGKKDVDRVYNRMFQTIAV